MAFSEATKTAAIAKAGYRCECRRIEHRHFGGRCNERLVTGRYDVHHKTSLLAGGSDSLSNAEALCIPCHENTYSYGRS
jgi:5-methylcytosine-specific restriction endonuclease McrA